MNKNLLILGAGIYGLIAKEIAESMGCFEKIAFADDYTKQAHNGLQVVGTTNDLASLADEYSNAIVAIGKSDIRSAMLEKIEKEPRMQLTTLISPRAFVSPSAQVGKGTIIEPMAVISTNCVLGKGCLICAGAVINHNCQCGNIVQADCNSTVTGNSCVPDYLKIAAGTVYQNK